MNLGKLFFPTWNDSVTGPLPNNRRPPSGLSNQVWDEIGRQLQIYIDAAHDARTGDADDLTYEFANEPWCRGAFGLEVGLSTAAEGATKALERGDLEAPLRAAGPPNIARVSTPSA